MPTVSDRLDLLTALARKVLWLSSWTIHHANHVRPNTDGLKVGGHQASSASLATIMTALYFAALRPEDRVAVKPNASPVFHAIQYLLGHQTRDKLENFRGYKGAQSYPSRTKDVDDVDFSTGSVGLGVAQALFASLVQDYVKAHGWAKERPEGRMIALVGDAELDEGNVWEAAVEPALQGLGNVLLVVDLNRQSLDRVPVQCLDAAVPVDVLAQGQVDRVLLRPLPRQPHRLGEGGVVDVDLRDHSMPPTRDLLDRWKNIVHRQHLSCGGSRNGPRECTKPPAVVSLGSAPQ